jgi:hypothetical protein
MKDWKELCAEQVAWYRKNGKHPDRICKDNEGVEFVAGDWAWNRQNDTSKREYIEKHPTFP